MQTASFCKELVGEMHYRFKIVITRHAFDFSWFNTFLTFALDHGFTIVVYFVLIRELSQFSTVNYWNFSTKWSNFNDMVQTVLSPTEPHQAPLKVGGLVNLRFLMSQRDTRIPDFHNKLFKLYKYWPFKCIDIFMNSILHANNFFWCTHQSTTTKFVL